VARFLRDVYGKVIRIRLTRLDAYLVFNPYRKGTSSGDFMNNPTFVSSGTTLSRIWHCFGNYTHHVDLPTVDAMLAASGTNVLPINTHHLDPRSGRAGLLIGFGDVRYDDLSGRPDVKRMVKMVNVNHQTTAEAAVSKTVLAADLTGERVIKLEVLNADLRTSNNGALIRAVKVLRESHPELVIMPLLQCTYDDARALIDLGCPLLRVMGSPIGSGGGLDNPDEFARICELGVDVVLDGGVGKPDHFRFAVELGAAGCLLNSMLFDDGRPPQVVLVEFMRELQPDLERFGAAGAEQEEVHAETE
jgi:thiazole synthase